MNRSDVQSFIDGYLGAGGDQKKIEEAVSKWLEKHPLYPQSKQDRESILNDLDSYRI